MALGPTVDILDVICCGLEVAGCVVTFGDEDVVIHTALKRLVQWNWGTLRMSADQEGWRKVDELTMNFSSILPRRSKPGANSRW
jgi:hypothetical protein